MLMVSSYDNLSSNPMAWTLKGEDDDLKPSSHQTVHEQKI